MRLIPAALAALVLCALSACTQLAERAVPPCEEMDAEGLRLFNEAGSLMEQHRYTEAEGVLDDLVEQFPEHFRSRRALQEVVLQDRGFEEALSQTEAAVKKERSAMNLTLLARLQKDGDRAIALLREALDKDGSYIWARYGLAFLLLKDQQAQAYPEARKQLEEALAQCPAFYEARRLLIECLHRMGDAAGERDQLRALLSFRPDDLGARYNLADLLRIKFNDCDGALKELDRILKQDPHRTDALLLRGIVLTQAGEYKRAENQFLDLQDVHPDALLNLAFLYRDHLDAPQKALDCFRKYLDYSGPKADERSFLDRQVLVPTFIERLTEKKS